MILNTGLRYDMPVAFGPSPVPDKTFVKDAGAFVLSFETEQAAARALVADGFELAERPIVSVGHVFYHDVDYLGGRSYNEIVVTISARHGEAAGALDAGYAVVLWVNQVGALIAGREYMGLPKLLADIPDAPLEGEALRFTCFEYEAQLLVGEASNLRSVAEDKLAALNVRAGQVGTFGRKYIAGPGGTAHIDTHMLNVMRWNYRSAWTGTGAVEFFACDRRAAPMSFQASAALAALPQLGPVRAFYGIGEAVIDRAMTRSL